MSGAASDASFEARPLTEQVDRTAVREFTRQLKAQGRMPSGNGQYIIVFAVVGIMVLGFGSTVLGGLVSLIASASSRVDPGFWLAFLAPMVLGLGVVVFAIVAGARGLLTGATRRYRLDRFARANAMTYEPVLANPPLPGMIFDLGSARSANDLVRGSRPRFVEFANYRYTTGSGKNRTTHKWGYVAVKLDVPLPHIVLDAKSNNSLFGSNLPERFTADQRLGLEGDFDRHFSLYCPSGYEADALYLFTPDIMARFIDNTAALDVEIVDDWLFLYGKRDFSTLDPATWAWLFSVVGALLDKLAQWGRWRDERLQTDASAPAASFDLSGAALTGALAGGDGRQGGAGVAASALPFAAPGTALRPPPGVAQQGRRLRSKAPVVGIVIVVLFAAYWILGQFGGLVSLLR